MSLAVISQSVSFNLIVGTGLPVATIKEWSLSGSGIAAKP